MRELENKRAEGIRGAERRSKGTEGGKGVGEEEGEVQDEGGGKKEQTDSGGRGGSEQKEGREGRGETEGERGRGTGRRWGRRRGQGERRESTCWSLPKGMHHLVLGQSKARPWNCTRSLVFDWVPSTGAIACSQAHKQGAGLHVEQKGLQLVL